MTKIQYDIPDDIHRKAKIAAALEGITLKDWIIATIDYSATLELKAQGEEPS